MQLNSRSLRLCSFNCRSVKSSVNEIRELCSHSDIVCVQEHWLLPSEINFLSGISDDFLAVGQSAVNIHESVLLGRPYGGTGILYRKTISEFVIFVDTDDPRLTAVILSSNVGPILLVCVYMPTDYGDDECLENYVSTCASLTSLYNDCDAVQLIAVGDFNCSAHSRFYDIMLQFALENNVMLTDINRLADAFTYCNDSATNLSWIDHVLCSRDVDNLVSSCTVGYDYVSSDHKPLFVCVEDLLPESRAQPRITNSADSSSQFITDWSKCNDYYITNYQYELDRGLSEINIPSFTPSHYTDNGDSQDTNALIDAYYDDIMRCINAACRRSIPNKAVNYNNCDFIVAGWNDIVRDKHSAARDAFHDWACFGKPRQGSLYDRMKRTRSQFKLALRYCKQHEDTIRADALADSMRNKDYNKFWNTIRKCNNKNATKFAHVVDGCTGDVAIANRWCQHFNDLYNSVNDDVSRDSLYKQLSDSVPHSSLQMCRITVQDIANACCQLKSGKALGPDGIAAEALIFGTNKLHIHISLLFNLFIIYGHLPARFMQSIIIPLIKNKNGDLSDLNNYRAIAISTVFSKLFEGVIEKFLHSSTFIDNYQFGFKRGLSTGLCTSVFKQTVDYYINRGSHVFACFVDFKKAFDSVNYWKLFLKLLNDGVNALIVRLLAAWYCNQICYVRWRSTVSTGFHMSNGTRQGGSLSPYLFTRYIREMLGAIVDSGIGCSIGSVLINVLAYADDLVLIAPSWKALQLLLDILNVQAAAIDMHCNTDKTVCMMFPPLNRRRIISNSFPLLKIGANYVKYVSRFKYLGHIVSNSLSDDDEIEREIRNMFVRCNTLTRKFSKCSLNVKVALFRSYCLCLYDIALWNVYKTGSLLKFRSCYHRCAKLFFKYRKYDSVTCMLLETGLPSFETIISNANHVFNSKWSSCSNVLVTALHRLHLPYYCT